MPGTTICRAYCCNVMNRKHFIQLAAAGTAAVLPHNSLKAAAAGLPLRAVAFDAYTLFDTSSILLLAEKLYPGKGAELMAVWRNRQFEYTWLRSLTATYTDFWAVTQDALVYAAAFLKLEMGPQNKAGLMQSFLDMKFVPGAGQALASLKAKGLKLAILSNVTPAMLNAGINNSGLQGVFDFVISTDCIKTYKPSPAAYQLGVNAFKVDKKQILFVAFGGWDAAGAKAFGYPVAWINASGQPTEQLGNAPDFICASLAELPGVADRF